MGDSTHTLILSVILVSKEQYLETVTSSPEKTEINKLGDEVQSLETGFSGTQVILSN